MECKLSATGRERKMFFGTRLTLCTHLVFCPGLKNAKKITIIMPVLLATGKMSDSKEFSCVTLYILLWSGQKVLSGVFVTKGIIISRSKTIISLLIIFSFSIGDFSGLRGEFSANYSWNN